MKEYKDAVYTKSELHLVICNICGQPIKKNEFGYFDDYISIEKKWGFGSEFDGDTHSLDICQSCYKKILENTKVSPLNQ